MADVITCPTDSELQQLLRGEAAPDVAEAFAHHLEQCSRCADAVEWSLPGDTVLEAMKGLATAHDPAASPVVQALIQRFTRIYLADPPAAQSTLVGADLAGGE